MRTLAFLDAAELDQLRYPPACPFNVTRASRTRAKLQMLGLLHGPDRGPAPARPASRAELETFHNPAYLDELQRAAAGDLTVAGLHMGLGGPDTPVFPDMFEYGRWAAGATLTAADLILTGRASIAVNLWGGFHHAFAEKASGFCYINDVVLGCQRLAAAGKKVLCLDLDAHHGDGTQAAFYDRRDVFTISLHETGHHLFPWGGFETETGTGAGLGYNVNVPLPPQTYDEIYRYAFSQVVPPLIHAYRPDVLVVELGMDTLAGDPLTHFCLTNNVIMDILRVLLAFGKPMLVTGGGGYHVENTVRGWTLAWKTLAGDEEDWAVGLGGVMLASSEWVGGLQDHDLPVSAARRAAVEPPVRQTVAWIRQHIFPYHGLPAGG